MVFDLFGIIFSKKNFLTFLVLQGGSLTKKIFFLPQIDSWSLKSAQMCFLAKICFFILGQKEGSVPPKRPIQISNGRILDKKTPRVMPRDTIRIVITKKKWWSSSLSSSSRRVDSSFFVKILCKYCNRTTTINYMDKIIEKYI